MKGEIKCMKCLLFAMNFILWCFGLAGLGIGIWMTKGKFFLIPKELDLDMLKIAAYIIIALSCLLIILGFLGYCGAAQNSSCLLITYSALVGFLLVVYIVFASLLFAAVKDPQFRDRFAGKMDEAFKKSNDTGLRNFLKLLEDQLKCCGVYNSSFYRQPPPSCQKEDGTNYETGCAFKLLQEVEDEIGIAAGVAAGVAAFMILTLVFTTCVICSLTHKEQVKNYIQ